MTDKNIRSIIWHLIIIDDAPKFLLGKSFIDIFQLLFSTRKFNFIITDSIEGSGKDWVISNLQENQNKIFKFEEIIKILGDITQLEWGDFFYLKSILKIGQIQKELYIPRLLPNQIP